MFTKLNSRMFLWLAVAAVGAVLILLPSFFRDRRGQNNPSPTGQVTTVSPTASPAAVNKTPTVTRLPRPASNNDFLPTPPPRSLITGPANCSVNGIIRFVAENIYRTEGAKITYTNVDDYSRFIFWKVSPDDGVLTVGPNIFSQLILPNGERDIGVSIAKPSSIKSYTLTASVTYGVIKSNGSEEIKESACSGSATVIMPVGS